MRTYFPDQLPDDGGRGRDVRSPKIVRLPANLSGRAAELESGGGL